MVSVSCQKAPAGRHVYRKHRTLQTKPQRGDMSIDITIQQASQA